MISLPAGTQIWLAVGATDMRKSFDGLAALVQSKLHDNAFSGHVFVFRGRRGDRGQYSVVVRRRHVPVRKAPREREVCLAADEHGGDLAHGSAALDAARGDRLAKACAHTTADDGSVRMRDANREEIA